MKFINWEQKGNFKNKNKIIDNIKGSYNLEFKFDKDAVEIVFIL